MPCWLSEADMCRIWTELCFVHYCTFWTWIIPRIRAWLVKLSKIKTDNQMSTWLSQQGIRVNTNLGWFSCLLNLFCFSLSDANSDLKCKIRSYRENSIAQSCWQNELSSLSIIRRFLPKSCQHMTEKTKIKKLSLATSSHFGLLIISRINRAWLYEGLNDSHRQPNSDLAQPVEWWSGGCGFNPHWGQFFILFFLSILAGCCQDLAENNEL